MTAVLDANDGKVKSTKMSISQIHNNSRQDCCPLCLSNHILLSGKLGYQETVNFSTHAIRLCHLPELWKCQNCQSSFIQNTVDLDTAKVLYAAGNAGERWATETFDKNKAHNVVDYMERIFKKQVSVLDVGCNTGELLDYAREFGCETAGVEFSSASREILNHKGHKAYSSLYESAEAYDVITAFDLVEHLYDVPAFLKDCRKKLVENGKLVILTGNVGSLSSRLSGAQWWYAQYPEHVVFPSKKFFSKYSGYQIEEWIPTYASKGYSRPVYWSSLELIKTVLRGRMYVGLPSLGPDHVLVVLSK